MVPNFKNGTCESILLKSDPTSTSAVFHKLTDQCLRILNSVTKCILSVCFHMDMDCVFIVLKC